MHDHSPEPEIDRLRNKLELAIHYLMLLDLPGRAEGFDFTPEGWDITAAELIQRLDPDDSDEDPPQEENAETDRLRQAEAQMRSLKQVGWKWQNKDDGTKVLAHPTDPDMNIWFHPYSGEQLLSPKLVERLKQDAQNERERGTRSD